MDPVEVLDAVKVGKLSTAPVMACLEARGRRGRRSAVDAVDYSTSPALECRT